MKLFRFKMVQKAAKGFQLYQQNQFNSIFNEHWEGTATVKAMFLMNCNAVTDENGDTQQCQS